MQKCEKCGAYFSDFDKVCPHCGWTAEATEEEKESISEQADSVFEKYTSGTGTTDDPYHPRFGDTSHYGNMIRASDYPMKWHKFLMVMMIVGSVFSIISAFNTISYPEYPSDKMYGFAVILLSVFQLYVRNRMKAFRKDGPKLLMILYALDGLINVLYTISIKQVFVMKGLQYSSLLDSQIAAEIITPLIMILISRKYYNRRRELFAN